MALRDEFHRLGIILMPKVTNMHAMKSLAHSLIKMVIGHGANHRMTTNGEMHLLLVGSHFNLFGDSLMRWKMKSKSFMRSFIVGMLVLLCKMNVVGEMLNIEIPTTVRQRYPWNGLVDIVCDEESMRDAVGTLTFSIVDMATGQSLKVETLTRNGVAFTNGVSTVDAGQCNFLPSFVFARCPRGRLDR